MEKPFTPRRPSHSLRPACHAFRLKATSWVIFPFRLITRCAEALAAGLQSQEIDPEALVDAV